MINIVLFVTLGFDQAVHLKFVEERAVLNLSQEEKGSIKLCLVNPSNKSIQLWSARFYPNHRWTLKGHNGKLAQETELGLRGAKLFGSLDRGKNAPVVVKPGKSYFYATPPLLDAFLLKPGNYLLVIEYADQSFGKKLSLSTQRLEIRVNK